MQIPPKVIIDTCVFEAALRSRNGASYRILSLINKGAFRYGLSVPMILEYEYRFAQLHQTIPSLTEQHIEAILTSIIYFADAVPIYFSVRPNLRDENDNHIFECCVNYGTDMLITHNIRDFQNSDLRPYSFQILTPREFSYTILQNGDDDH